MPKHLGDIDISVPTTEMQPFQRSKAATAAQSITKQSEFCLRILLSPAEITQHV